MKIRWVGLLAGLVLALLAVVSAEAAGSQPGDEQAGRAVYLCPPRLQLRHPEMCPDLGPGKAVEDLARLGLYPARPLPGVQIDAYLGTVNFSYVRMGDSDVELYGSAENALLGENPTGVVSKGFVYYTLIDSAESEEGGTVYRIGPGWVRGEDVSLANPSRLRGLVFSSTPLRPFAWINSGGTCSQRAPASEDYTGNCYVLHQVVQIYDTQQVGEWLWYMIGEDEWIDQRFLSVVQPDLNRPPGVDSDKWISINLYEQSLAAYEGGQLVFATTISSGRRGAWTQPGLFRVWARLDFDTMTGGVASESGSGYYYLEYVPWVMYFDQARALHGTYWHDKFGTPTSRGCVNMSIADAHWLYSFATIDTWVYVWDPSGNTPTDPAEYGPGGA
jgi:hypothetical protein